MPGREYFPWSIVQSHRQWWLRDDAPGVKEGKAFVNRSDVWVTHCRGYYGCGVFLSPSQVGALVPEYVWLSLHTVVYLRRGRELAKGSRFNQEVLLIVEKWTRMITSLGMVSGR